MINHSPRSLLIIATLSVLLYRIPLIDKLIRSFHTLIHETGHSIVAFITSGKTHRIELHPNMSGFAITESSSKFQQFLISLGGYVFASSFAYFSFLMINAKMYKILILLLIGIVFFQLLLNVRNTFGIVWSIVSIVVLSACVFYQPQLAYAISVMISSVVLIDSVLTSAWIMILSLSKPKQAGDAFNLQKTTSVPAFFWGLFFFVQALFFTYLVYKIQLNTF